MFKVIPKVKNADNCSKITNATCSNLVSAAKNNGIVIVGYLSNAESKNMTENHPNESLQFE